MGRLFDALMQFLESEEWPLEQLAGKETLRSGYVGDSGRWRCFASVDEDKAQAVFYSIYPDKADAARYPAVAEFLHRANYGLVLGNFEFDYDDGEIRFRTGMDVEKVDLTPDLFVPLVYANVAQMNRYFDGLRQVLANEASPADAIRAIEERPQN